MGSDGRLEPEPVASGSARLVFRCHGCGVRFAGDAGGPGVCPRCGAIGGHDRETRPR